MTYITYFLVFITNPKKVIKIRTKQKHISTFQVQEAQWTQISM